ncbi:mitochondrial inner membrane protein OXA1L isoform X2 [Protopterus annectens]|uniref:mitochondrial inner membrane protein OXA1L isoform X2 n=1 Tax=Protopterus annectens TaxID=7888 RepID=UPI001CFAA7BC|nr:mitochondrial inner membrane protein OXA1L isoform X2 [Protopterus annectens]
MTQRYGYVANVWGSQLSFSKFSGLAILTPTSFPTSSSDIVTSSSKMAALWKKGMGIVNRRVFSFCKEIMPVAAKPTFVIRAVLLHQVPSLTEVISPVTPASPVTEATVPPLNPSLSLPEIMGPVPEISLTELGLGGYTPVGMVQNFLEFLHVDLGMPWWGAIVAGTVLARCLVFPLIVKGQREAAKLNNHMPEMSRLTNKMNEAKRSGNKFEFSKAYSDLMLFQKKHDINPLRGFLVPMVQAPVFISFFIALRKMAYLPVPSMQTGGLWWFSDLTVADPYYILPLAVTGSMWAILELGAESGVNNPNLQTMKTVFRIMPLIILPLTINFPTAVFTYWMTSNVFSLAQVAFLNIPAVREKLKIPERVQHDPSVLPKSEGFIKSMKTGWKNAQLAQQLEERERKIKHHLDIAAKGPLRQTFAQNPLQQKESTQVSVDGVKKGKKKQWENPLD